METRNPERPMDPQGKPSSIPSTFLQLSGAAALAAFAYLCLTLSATVHTQQKHLAATEMQLGETIAHVNQASAAWADASAQQVKSFAAIERDIRVEMWQLNRTLQAASGAIDTANAQLTHVGPLLDSTRATTEQATATLTTAQQTVQALQAPITQATTTLAALQPVIAHTDALVSDPNIAGTIANVQSTTGHLDATAKDVQAEVYKYTHPGIWAKVKGALLDIAHVFNPL